MPNISSHQVIVDYGIALDQMIGGRLEIDPDAQLDGFFIKGQDRVSAVLSLAHFHLEQVTMHDIKHCFKMNDIKPAGLEHLIALGVQCRDLMGNFSIVALGADWRGLGVVGRVPRLTQLKKKRVLGSMYDQVYWSKDYFILGVHKQEPITDKA